MPYGVLVKQTRLGEANFCLDSGLGHRLGCGTPTLPPSRFKTHFTKTIVQDSSFCLIVSSVDAASLKPTWPSKQLTISSSTKHPVVDRDHARSKHPRPTSSATAPAPSPAYPTPKPHPHSLHLRRQRPHHPRQRNHLPPRHHTPTLLGPLPVQPTPFPPPLK